MRILNAEEMRAVDRVAIEDWGIDGLVLMENAALGVVDAMVEAYPQASSATIFCGPGNNGGDGLAIARHLTLRGYQVLLVMVAWSRNRSDAAARQFSICAQQDIPRIHLEEDSDLADLGPLDSDLWVDALFGTGLGRPLEGLFAATTERFHHAPCPVVAVDLPSGLEAGSGDLIGVAGRADLTVTLGALKWPHVFTPAAERCGEVVVADLGIPSMVLEEAPGDLSLLIADELGSYLLDREPDAHKGDFGHCLIVAGSPGKSGAAILAAQGAVVGGAGLVTVAVPQGLLSTVEAASIESMSLPLVEDASGRLSGDAAGEILSASEDYRALALGPGLGTSASTVQAIREIVRSIELPLVLDADGLNAMAGASELLQGRTAPTVLTPHPGEAARLADTSVEDIQRDRLAFARRVAVEWQVVLVLKGHATLVATPEGSVYVNSTGNPGMASGGTGDVLTGIVAALLAQNYDPGVAACLAVFVHGLAGDLAVESRGLEGLRATDLLAEVPGAFRLLREA